MPSMPECPTNVCPEYSIPQYITSEMLQMIISDYVPNTAGFTYFNLGMLKTQIINSMIPSWSPVKLNTSSFECILNANCTGDFYWRFALDHYKYYIILLTDTSPSPCLVQQVSRHGHGPQHLLY
jgi:hypothetical protein